MTDEPLVTIFSPDGTQGQVPQSRVHDAIAAGGKLGVHIYSPDGTPGYVPQDKLPDALHAGGRMEPPALSDNPNSEGTYKMVSPQGQSVSVPFSKVRGAQDQRFAISPEDAGRYTKDSTGSIRQGIQASFDANTATSPDQSLLKTGLQSVVRGAGQAFVHPVDTAVGIAKSGIQASIDPSGLAEQAIAPVAQSYREAGGGAKGAAYAGTKLAGETLGGIAVGEAIGGGVRMAAPYAARVPGAVAQGASAASDAMYPKNLSLTPSEAQAQAVVKALQPDKAAIANIKSASPELGDALAYAEREGIPQNGKLDTAKAVTGRAQEIQNHYDQNILSPNGTTVVQVPEGYQGELSGNGRATLNQLNDRVDAINRDLKTSFRKPLPGQLTGASDAELMAEHGQLTDILHNGLSEATGIPAEDIADLRQRAGKLRSLAQEIKLSADNDTLGAGKKEVGGATFSPRNPLEGVTDALGGGQEIIGNRVWKNALDQIPAAEKPLPQPAPPAAGVPTTPEAAQAEFLKAQQLEQSAQDQAAGRTAQVSSARQRWASQGYAKVLQHVNEDGAIGLTAGDVQKVGLTPEGKTLLIKASDLTPGTPAMRNLIQQIKSKLGATN